MSRMITFKVKPIVTTLAIVAALMLVVPSSVASRMKLAADATPPIQATFYYPWFPETEGWATQYTPMLGKYDSGNRTVLAAHVAMMKYAGLDAAISSWWGVGTPTDNRLPAFLDTAAAQPGFGVTPYYEKEGKQVSPSDPEVTTDLTRLRTLTGHPGWLKVAGKPVLFVYNAGPTVTTCAVVDKWRRLAPDFYLNMKVFSGYRSCTNQPDSWHQYGPATAMHKHLPAAVNVSPGFFKFNETTPRLVRDLDRFKINVSQAADSGVTWQLVTSFNEWGEGTAVEPAAVEDPQGGWQSTSGMGDYLDAMRAVFVHGQRFGAVTIAAAGDISCEPGLVLDPKVQCAEPLTADVIVAMNPAGVLALGDLQYTAGQLANFRSEYDPAWGRFKNKTYPAPGNHEWGTPNAQGYRDYFATGVPPEVTVNPLWYSFDKGGWHFVSLDSDCAKIGGCDDGDLMFEFLQSDLAANNGKPTVVYWHHARYTSDTRGDTTALTSMWNVLVDDKDVKLNLAGHTHHYERFTRMGKTGPDPAGFRSFIIGTGGRNHICPGVARRAGSEIVDCTTFGVGKFTLKSDGSYDWRFVAAADTGAFTDSGTEPAR